MKLDRNLSADGRGKYGLIKNREVARLDQRFDGGDGDVADLQAIRDAIALLERAGIIDWANTPETECFVIRLKDEGATSALAAYSGQYYVPDKEYSDEVFDLSQRSGIYHPNRKKAD